MKVSKVIQLISLIVDSTIPVDIKKHLEEEHYSKSKDKQYKGNFHKWLPRNERW